MADPRRILLIRLRAIGDVVLTTPLFRAIKSRYPASELHVLTDLLPGSLLVGNPHVDRLITAPSRKSSFREQFAFLASLRKNRYDLVFDLFGNPRSALMTLATGAPTRVGYAHRIRRFAYNHPVPKNQARKYQVDVNLDVLRHVGIPDTGLQTELFMSPGEVSWANGIYQQLRINNLKLKIALNLTGSWSAKRWPVRYWNDLVKILAGKGIQPLIFWSPGDKESITGWAELLGDKVVLAPATDLRQLAALISKLDLLVGNDGAPHHIAQALGVKTLTLFGPTWGLSWNLPGDARFPFLQSFPSCGPCDKTLCPNPAKGKPFYKECLEATTPQRVMAGVEEMLGMKS